MTYSQFVRLILVSIMLLSSTSMVRAQQASGPSSATDDPLYAPLIDSAEADYLESTGTLTRYIVEAEFVPVENGNLAKISGESTITYQNETGDPLTDIYLRLYANVLEYSDGSMTVANLAINGKPAEGDLSESETLLTIEVPQPLSQGDSLDLSFGFETIIPTDPAQSYGMFKYDSASNTYSLAHWMPLLAGWDSENGWNTDPVSANGDPVYTEAAVFDLTLEAPSNLVFANSGSELEREETNPGIDEIHYSSGPSRDFVMTASEDFVIQEAISGETTVRSFAREGFDDGSKQVLRTGIQALESFTELIGPYPYEEMDFVQVAIGNGAGGVEFPGLMYIGANFYDDAGFDADIPGFLEFIVAHEVGHQWFYNVVGNNQYQHAFLDEGLVSYLTVVYFADNYGAEVANEQANLQLRLGYFDRLFQRGDEIVDQPTDDFSSMSAYGAIVYGKGGLAFMELRAEIGTEAFFDALQSYYEEFAFRVAEPQDLLEAFEQSSGEDLADFWDHWFLQAAGQEDFDATDLARVLRELGE